MNALRFVSLKWIVLVLFSSISVFNLKFFFYLNRIFYYIKFTCDFLFHGISALWIWATLFAWRKKFLTFSQTLIRYCMIMSGKLNNEISSFCRFADSTDVKQVSIVQTISVFQKNHSLDKDPPELCLYNAIWSTNSLSLVLF